MKKTETGERAVRASHANGAGLGGPASERAGGPRGEAPGMKSRRKFLSAVPAAVAGAVAAKAYAQQGGPAAGPVKPATIEAAESIMGLDFHPEDEAALANNLNNR